jgi:hypothetical protein
MTERGWGWNATEVRQAQLVEWLVSQQAGDGPGAGRDYPVDSFYDALPDQSANGFETALGDLESLRRDSLVKFRQFAGGLRAFQVQVTQRACDQADEWRANRGNMRLRRAACRDALVSWLHARDAVTALHPPVLEQMLADPGHGLWLAEPFTGDDLDEAAAWLDRKGLIKGTARMDQRTGPVRAYLTDDGVSCGDDFDCYTGRYLDAQRQAPASGHTVNIAGGNSGAFQVAGDFAHQVQNLVSPEDLRLRIAGIAEIVRAVVPDASEDGRKEEEAALAAVSTRRIDEPALRRFCDWAVTTVQAGANNAVIAAISSTTTYLPIEASRLAAHLA